MKEVIDIERLVTWAFRDQAVEQAECQAAISPGFVRSAGMFGIDRVALYGCKIDGSGEYPGLSDYRPVADDALEVLDAVRTVPGSWLVRMHGLLGTRPDDMVGVVPAYVPVTGQAGKNQIDKYYPDGSLVVPRSFGGKHRGDLPRYPACRVKLSPSWAQVRADRAEWSEWRGGLFVLAGYFASNAQALKKWRVTGPAVPAEPWNEGV